MVVVRGANAGCCFRAASVKVFGTMIVNWECFEMGDKFQGMLL